MPRKTNSVLKIILYDFINHWVSGRRYIMVWDRLQLLGSPAAIMLHPPVTLLPAHLLLLLLLLLLPKPPPGASALHQLSGLQGARLSGCCPPACLPRLLRLWRRRSSCLAGLGCHGTCPHPPWDSDQLIEASRPKRCAPRLTPPPPRPLRPSAPPCPSSTPSPSPWTPTALARAWTLSTRRSRWSAKRR